MQNLPGSEIRRIRRMVNAGGDESAQADRYSRFPDLLVAACWVDDADQPQLTLQEALDGALDDCDAGVLGQLHAGARLVSGYSQDEEIAKIEAAVKNSEEAAASDSG